MLDIPNEAAKKTVVLNRVIELVREAYGPFKDDADMEQWMLDNLTHANLVEAGLVRPTGPDLLRARSAELRKQSEELDKQERALRDARRELERQRQALQRECQEAGMHHRFGGTCPICGEYIAWGRD